MLQFFFLGSESEQSLRYALFQWNRMDSLFELAEQPLNPPKSPSREVLERGLSRGKVRLWLAEGLEILVGLLCSGWSLGRVELLQVAVDALDVLLLGHCSDKAAIDRVAGCLVVYVVELAGRVQHLV